MQDLLSQDEIDALLDQVAAQDEAEADSGESRLGVRTFDLASQQRIVRGRLSGLESLNQRLSGKLRSNLVELLRRDLDVDAQPIATQRYGDFLHSLYVPSSLNLITLAPLPGTALVVLDARLVFRMVDYFFGGAGRDTKIEGRDFTPTEERVIEKFMARVYRDLEDVWRGVIDLSCRPQGAELNPSMASIVGAADDVIVSRFQIGFGNATGEMQLVIPEAMLEPVRDSLEAVYRGNSEEIDRHWRANLEQQLGGVEVGIRCRVAETTLRLRELANLQVGDFIPVNLRSGSSMLVEGVPVYRVKTGVVAGRWALRVTRGAPRAASEAPRLCKERTGSGKLPEPRGSEPNKEAGNG